MSVFRKFKLPQLLRKGPPASEIGEDIPRFKCSELPLKQRLGQGSFGDVYTAEYRASGDTKCHTVVVKKMLQVLDQEEKKLFYKEVRLLNDLQHPNIVQLKGVSFQPLAMMLEYIYFDFKLFGSLVRMLENVLICLRGQEILTKCSFCYCCLFELSSEKYSCQVVGNIYPFYLVIVKYGLSSVI